MENAFLLKIQTNTAKITKYVSYLINGVYFDFGLNFFEKILLNQNFSLWFGSILLGLVVNKFVSFFYFNFSLLGLNLNFQFNCNIFKVTSNNIHLLFIYQKSVFYFFKFFNIKNFENQTEANQICKSNPIKLIEINLNGTKKLISFISCIKTRRLPH